MVMFHDENTFFQVHSSVKELSEDNFWERYHRMSKQMELQLEL